MTEPRVGRSAITTEYIDVTFPGFTLPGHQGEYDVYIHAGPVSVEGCDTQLNMSVVVSMDSETDYAFTNDALALAQRMFDEWLAEHFTEVFKL